ncbi:MAG: GHMP kinase [Clostridia bacterium]|nr:GHMP kinase [Clostridia bacterium]
MSCSDEFEKYFGCEPDGEVFCPYRVCPLGAHTDHNLGLVTGFALDKGITIAFSVCADGVIAVKSTQFETEEKWFVNGTPENRRGDWADYLRGVTVELKKNHTLDYGVNAFIEGSFSPGGLSSSAAVTLAFLNALCRANNIKLNEKEYINTAQNAERNYVGVMCGTLDQSCEILCRKDKLLFLDTLDGSYSLVQAGKNAKPYEIGLFFSGKGHRLVGSKYNSRADELKSAARALGEFAGIMNGDNRETVMRDIDRDVFELYKNRLTVNRRKRAEHWFGECERVKAGVEAWKNGDIERFGSLMNKSGKSSIELWETGSEELTALTEILTHTGGIYGARFSGAGFGGCCIALIDPAKHEEIAFTVKNEYSRLFPQLDFSAAFCESSDGMKI